MKSRPLRRIRDHLQRLLLQAGVRIRIGPRSYRVRGYVSNTLGIDSPHEVELHGVIARLLARPGHFIDVGVNLGQTLGKVLAADPQRLYLGFEPQIAACFFCQRFLKDNGLKHVHILPIGLSDQDGIRKFWSRGEADTMASLIDPGDGAAQLALVPVRRGDSVLQELGIDTVAAIKVDVEGAELEVLRGLKQTLQRQHPPVMFEMLPNFTGTERTAVSVAEAAIRRAHATALHGFFVELGYSMFQIDAAGNEIAIDGFELDDPGRYRGSNFIARSLN